MDVHVIVGSGQVGAGLARALADSGHEVRVVTRTGRGPEVPGVQLVAADAADPIALGRVAAGATVLYNCANPPYHRWVDRWPPLAASLLGAAASSGAVLVTMGNLYGYGPVDHPISERDPLVATTRKGGVRNAMWAEARAAHEAGTARVTEARASDFFGPGADANSHLGTRFVAPLLAGRTAWVVGDPDAPHSWTYLPDVVRTLVALGTHEAALGRAWHVPTAPPASMRDVATRICALAGAPEPRVRSIPHGALRLAGLVVPMLRELEEVRYQLTSPFVIDASDAVAAFGIEPTPFDDALGATVDRWRTGGPVGRHDDRPARKAGAAGT